MSFVGAEFGDSAYSFKWVKLPTPQRVFEFFAETSILGYSSNSVPERRSRSTVTSSSRYLQPFETSTTFLISKSNPKF